MKTSNAKIGGVLWTQWVLVSILGFGVGAGIGNAVANAIPPMTCAQSFSDSLMERLMNLPCIQPSLGLVVIVIILGLAGGFMQWLVLRRRIAGAGWWVPGTSLGFPIALVIAEDAMRLVGGFAPAPILQGVLFGVMSAITPMLVLRRQIARAGWWLPAHLLGSLAGGALGIVAFHVVGLIGFYELVWAAAGAMFGAGLGAITGITLAWLLRHTISEG